MTRGDNGIWIQITKKDLENGIKVHPRQCPIALALKRKVKHAERVIVGHEGIFVFYVVHQEGETGRYGRVSAYLIDHTAEMQEFIEIFDHGDQTQLTPTHMRLPELRKYTLLPGYEKGGLS